MGDNAGELGSKLNDLMEVNTPGVLGSTAKLSNNINNIHGSLPEVIRKLEGLASSSFPGASRAEVMISFRKSREEEFAEAAYKRRDGKARVKALMAKEKERRARQLAANNSGHVAPPPASEYDPSIAGSSAPRERDSERGPRDRSPPHYQQREVQQYSGSSAPRERDFERGPRDRSPPHYQQREVQQYSGFSTPRERYSERRSRERSPPQHQQREAQQYRQRDNRSREGSRYRGTSPSYQGDARRSIHEAGASRNAQTVTEAWARRQSLLVKKPMKDRWIWQSKDHPPFYKKAHLTKARQAEFETRGLECLDHSKRFKITAVCGSCGHKHHYLCDCPIPDESSGFVSGCPLCNTTTHNWDDCERSGVLNWVEQYEIMFFRRINIPPIRSRKPWIMWEKERIDQRLSPWDLQRVYPWTLAFVEGLKHSERPWVNFDHKLWREERAKLPKDPATHRYSAEELIDYAPLLEERDASDEDNVSNSGNTLQSGFNATVHNNQTSQDVVDPVAAPVGSKRERTRQRAH
ncbi:hypothetical protein CFIO01_00467 [Colletotrichum fioriniae PJ7]|uniref:Uncharacterized protein n=1 Tax=Colletotrichum fioriniae PJ7 TaxID=1445577 RepID=A0A010Q841_9PEZI|nr:hypothetical protein CFIO01_00467 [Colletotrichum fioriniae PJ7]